MDTVPVFIPRREAGVLLPERTTRLMHRAYDWRIWWIPVIPGEPVFFECPTPETAVRLLDTLALYDLWLTDQRIMPDVANAGGVQRWESKPTPENPRLGEWVDVEWDDDLQEWLD